MSPSSPAPARDRAPTGLAYVPECLEHDNGSMVLDRRARDWIEVAHAEGPDRVERAHRVLVASGAADSLEPISERAATEEELALVHTPDHIAGIREAARAGELAWVGPEARVGPGSWRPALLSAGAGLAAVDWALERPRGRAYCLTRPPGHHASEERAMGFCLFNNVALAARYARDRHGLGRIAIVDWDVHHGNGTQDVFYEDPDVLFVSIHQDGLYPADMGTLGQRGEGRGDGATLNLPMPPGSGDAGYVAACREVVAPAVVGFEPDLILLSSGQDAAASDPLGRMSVTAEGFRRMTATLAEAADAACEGRLVALQEGGYSIDHMPFCVLATIEAMAGLRPACDGDPIELDVPTGLGEAERAAVDRARRHPAVSGGGGA